MIKSAFNFFLILCFGYICLLFQSTLLHEFFGMYKPNLFVIMVSYLALNRFAIEGAILSFIFGYFLDLNSGAPFGFYPAVLILTFYGAKIFNEAFLVHSTIVEMGFVALVGIFFKLSYLGIVSIYEPIGDLLIVTGVSLLSMVFLNFLLTPLVFGILKGIDQFLGKEVPSQTQ